MSKVLIVDDDEELSQQLQQSLRGEGWVVESASGALDGLQMLMNFSFDLVLLDWNMPDLTGLEVCRRYRAAGGHAPIIFLTGRGDVDSKESGLDSGADDYIVKPFEFRELMARIRSLQRRGSATRDNELTICGVALDCRARTISSDGKQQKLTATETNLLELLFRNPDKTFSSAELFEAVWPSDTESTEDTVRVHMRILRKKLSLMGLEDFVKTIRGSGYIISSAP